MDLKRIRLAAGEVPYLESGKGPNLLFLHGAIATSEAYIPLLTLLSETHHIIAPIIPGHGSAFPIPRDWKLVDLTRFFREYLIELDVGPEVVIGHSFGGTLALLLAASGVGHQVIAMDSPGLPFAFNVPVYTKALLAEAKEVIDKRPDLARLVETTKAAGTLFQTVIRHPDAITRFSKEGPKFNIIRELKLITVPVNLLWGEFDRVVPLRVARVMQQIIPKAQLTVLLGRGHNYSVTDPEFAYNEIMKVIQKP